MSPTIVRDGWVCAQEPGALVLTHPERGEVVLLGVAARLFELADGARSVAELARLTEAVPEDIFAALDELADHGLLAARVAPPAAPRPRSRREVLAVLAGAAATAAIVPLGVAAAAPELAPQAKEQQQKAPALAEQDVKSLEARPPREQVYKESAAKSEQHRKLADVGFSEQEEKLAPQLAAEEKAKGAASLLLAYEEAAKRADSPAEKEEKALVELPENLIKLSEAERKQEVAPLTAEEEDTKRFADNADAQRLQGAQAEEAIKLGAREQKAKLAGEFGVAEEQAHKELLAAKEQRRKQNTEQNEKQLRRAQERRYKVHAREAREDEQHDKHVAAARERRQKNNQAEQQEKVGKAEEQREKHWKRRVAEYRQRLAEQKQKRDEQTAAAKTNKKAEQEQKLQAAEQVQKNDIVAVELKAREHELKAAPTTDK